ncbi:Uncharacterised protein [Mycobacterium tuberculosis]|nr:Uncharacterised protein [Mycobacterium tuberculosis]
MLIVKSVQTAVTGWCDRGLAIAKAVDQRQIHGLSYQLRVAYMYIWMPNCSAR